MKKLVFIFLMIPFFLFSQEKISGIVTEVLLDNKMEPLAGANVYWLATNVGTVTNLEGKFSLPYKKEYSKLIISYVGYKTDTIIINKYKYISHVLKRTSTLDEVKIEAKKKAISKSYLQSKNIITVSSKELLKAACCNLSESFETNPSIDVNFVDAVSGTRQIRMLGLTSPYILIATENIPSIRGASQAYGLSFIPGTWVESIQITKGAGSVVNGYESIAGQINTELVKPTTDNAFFVNAYGAINGRLELNTHFNTKVDDKWSTGLYLHGDSRNEKLDRNNDSFLDLPLSKQVNVMNRWQYTNQEKGLLSFINLKYLKDLKQTGQVGFNPRTDKGTTNYWGSEIDTERYEISTKLGYVNAELPWQTVGFQTAFSGHEQNSYFGLNTYNINHNSLYANAIYNSIISDSRHKIKTGLSLTYDYYNELVNNTDYERTENSIGAFFEYDYDSLEKLNLTAGLRIDHHNLLGTFITPRFHLLYKPWEKSAFRASIGRGKRSANIFAENQKLFATSRTINIVGANGEIYGLDPEIAWNYGISYLQGFKLFDRKGDVTLDYYRTNFKNQVVVDYENSQQVNFYNLKGESFANSLQLELNYNAFEYFDLRLAYKYYDVKTDYNSGKLDKPLIPRHRMFSNASYNTAIKENGSQWKFDITFNWLGKQRLSSTLNSPIQYQLADYSPTVSTLNTQITKVFSSKFEVYFGAENITNTKQDNPIVSSNDPFGSNFDTTFVYGPIFGASYYLGLRFKIN